MRYCTLSKIGITPCLTNLSNIEIFIPFVWAYMLITTGANCLWSPIKTNCWHSLISGIKQAVSVAWVASSIITLGKRRFFKQSDFEPTHVAQITWASWMFRLNIEKNLNDWIWSSFLLEPVSLSEKYLCFSSDEGNSELLPILFDFTPSLRNSLCNKSTAILLSAQTSTGELGEWESLNRTFILSLWNN